MSIQPVPSASQQAYSSIMKGLLEIDLRGPCVPCPLVLNGDDALPLVMTTQGQVLMAASLYGRGRIVVLGHEGYLTAFTALVDNAVTWLSGDESDNLSVGVHQSVKAVANNLSKSKFQASVVDGITESVGNQVYVIDAYSVAAEAEGIVAYLKAGGGVLIAGQAWNWTGKHPKENTLRDFPGNKVSSVAGIYFSEYHWGEVECLPVYPQIPSSWLAGVIIKDFKEDLEFLLKDVSEFDIQHSSVPSEVLVHGQLAFPIGTTQDERAFLAGAYYGHGRVIVVTHEKYFNRQELAQFWNNALHWLSQGRKGQIGVHPSLDIAFSQFSQFGLSCKVTDFSKDLSVFVCDVYSDEHAEEILEFVAEGGGLLIGGHAWYWAQTHGEKNPLTEFPGNHIVNKMGLSVLGVTLEAGRYKAPVPDKACEDNYHFCHLLHRFAGHVTQGEELTKQEESFLAKLVTDCTTFLQMKAYDSNSYTQVVSTITDILKAGMPQVSVSSPVESPEDHLLLKLGAKVYNVSPDPDALLPYLIRNNPTMPVVYNHKIKIDAKTEGAVEWISTGLYLSPGMRTYMAMPAEIVNKRWKVQIGCQTDYLGHLTELKRAQVVHEVFDVTTEMMQVWNLWGGLIYLVAPPNTQVEGAEVTVQMAVLAPYYKSGVTTAAEWSSLRKAPAPWAEFECDNVILTVPSQFVRDLENPDEVAALWNDIMRAVADLAAIPHKLPRKERFVADVQISAGWMHSGYPVMMYGEVDKMFDITAIKNSDLWGPIHELGHNQQRDSWEFRPHTTECTCNLWSVYVHEEVLGIKRDKAHSALTSEERQRQTEEYVKGGRDLAKWNVWVALETYLQLQEQFGWDAFKKVFAAYHNMSDVPRDNKGKMNLYAETFSQAVGKNLAGFFKAWGWPIEPATEEKLSSLPPWSDHPMVQYG
uniref:TRPM8 channel-associated factor homolog n=1 Tax=Centroberyx gerrardi TaxID=166262 RepID=UPI003AAB2FEB